MYVLNGTTSTNILLLFSFKKIKSLKNLLEMAINGLYFTFKFSTISYFILCNIYINHLNTLKRYKKISHIYRESVTDDGQAQVRWLNARLDCQRFRGNV